MGTFRGKQVRKKRKKKKKQGPVRVFFIEVTSNLHVEVSMPRGNTKEAIPFKRDSLNHIPTHSVIRLDSKSILKPGPLDSSNPRSSSLNIPAHMNHSNSWLLAGISCPALSLFLSVWLLCWKLGRNPPSFDLDPEGERAGLNTGPWLWDRSERDMETWVCWEMPAHPSRDLVLYPSNCNMSSDHIPMAISLLVCPEGASSVRI